MPEQTSREKDEKQEKQEEKDEKARGEKFRNDPLGAVVWAAILIWVGLVFLAANLGLGAAQLEAAEGSTLEAAIFGWKPWSLALLGAGVIFLLEALVRTLRPEYHRPVGGTVVFGAILIAVGIGERFTWSTVWPIILIIIGAGLLLATLLRRR